MKFTLLLCASLFCYAFSYGQDANLTPNKNLLKVSLLKDSMVVTYNSQPVIVTTIQALDSLMKKIPDPEHQLKVEFESQQAEREKIRAIDVVLKQCKCPTMRKSVNFQ